MNVRISELPLQQIPGATTLILANEQLERALYKIGACTGKTRTEIKAFVTGSVVSYFDLAEFSAAFGRFPDLAEQHQLVTDGMSAFDEKLILMFKENISNLLDMNQNGF
jgi:hypothetical protein